MMPYVAVFFSILYQIYLTLDELAELWLESVHPALFFSLLIISPAFAFKLKLTFWTRAQTYNTFHIHQKVPFILICALLELYPAEMFQLQKVSRNIALLENISEVGRSLGLYFNASKYDWNDDLF